MDTDSKHSPHPVPLRADHPLPPQPGGGGAGARGTFNLVCFIRVHLWLFHSGDGETQPAHQLSRRFLAVSKNVAMVSASAFFSTRRNFCKSAMKASSDFARFLRLARAMSRHISGEPDAMRVVSRKPFAHSAA